MVSLMLLFIMYSTNPDFFPPVEHLAPYHSEAGTCTFGVNICQKTA